MLENNLTEKTTELVEAVEDVVVETAIDVVETVNDVEATDGDTPAEALEDAVNVVEQAADEIADETVEEVVEAIEQAKDEVKAEKTADEVKRELSKLLGINIFDETAVSEAISKLESYEGLLESQNLYNEIKDEYDRLRVLESDYNDLKAKILFKEHNVPESNVDKIKKIINFEMSADSSLNYEDVFKSVVAEYPELVNRYADVVVGSSISNEKPVDGVDAFIAEDRSRNPEKYKDIL